MHCVCMRPAQRGYKKVWGVKQIRIVVEVCAGGSVLGGGTGSASSGNRTAVWKLAGLASRNT
jgi:hypothetical protein